jgi:hypothetical protein
MVDLTACADGVTRIRLLLVKATVFRAMYGNMAFE